MCSSKLCSHAELAASLTLAAARRIVEADEFMRAGLYDGWLPHLFVGNLLKGQTVGVIGAGRIGSAYARMMLEMAEECLKHAMDLSGLLLLYSSLGDAEGISKLAILAKEQGKNNVAFLCLFMLGKLEDCLQLLIESNRIPEAALMARSYLPSKVSEIVAIWRKDLNKVNPKAAESLADPEEYPNLFEDWQVALAVESKAAETINVYPPAEQYVNHAGKSHVTLVEAFRNMQIEEEEPLENGDSNQELTEQNEEEHYTEEQNVEEGSQEEQHEEEGSQEEAVVVDAESTDGAVLVNGNEADEEWGTNNEGAPSA